jgi:hypothetical protein
MPSAERDLATGSNAACSGKSERLAICFKYRSFSCRAKVRRSQVQRSQPVGALRALRGCGRKSQIQACRQLNRAHKSGLTSRFEGRAFRCAVEALRNAKEMRRAMVIVSAHVEKNLGPFYINLRRMEPSTPSTPVPSSNKLAGSGVDGAGLPLPPHWLKFESNRKKSTVDWPSPFRTSITDE